MPLRSVKLKSAISRSALQSRKRRAPLGREPRAAASRRALTPLGPNYASRVLAGEFEPTALRARQVAATQQLSLHALAHQLGYAEAPPRVRRPFTAASITSLTPSELALRTGYHISAVCRFLAAKHPPTLTTLARIAAAYEAWMDDVLAAVGW